MNRKDLHRKLSILTSDLIYEKGYISFIDVFNKLGYLDIKDYELWRMKKIPCLEKTIKINVSKINFIMKTIQKNSLNGKLKPSWTEYKSWGNGKKVFLRFSKSGEENIEKLYATHFVKRKEKIVSNNKQQTEKLD